MVDMDTVAELAQVLTAPRRNNYFYGKLLTEEHLQMEQQYFNEKRWLLNHLSFGMGVFCGLQVFSRDTDDRSMLCISPGVAIDALGREIIVPREKCIDPWQVTDDTGRPLDELLDHDEDHVVTICLVYNECLDDHERPWAADCHVNDGTIASTIVESYCVVIQEEGGQADLTGHIPSVTHERPFPVKPNADDRSEYIDMLCAALMDDVQDRGAALTRLLAVNCAPPGQACAPLATVELITCGEIGSITPTLTPVYSNALLLEMILCLADRIAECCQIQVSVIKALRIAAGNNQRADAGTTLPNPIVVKVVNAVDGSPISGELVSFLPSSGSVDSAQIDTDQNGEAAVRWTLGAASDPPILTASIASGSQAIFQAVVEGGDAGEVGSPPVINSIWPPNASKLSEGEIPEWLVNWEQNPHLEIAFDREMNEEYLHNPQNWLRAWLVFKQGGNEITVRPVELQYGGFIESPMIRADGVPVLYTITVEPVDVFVEDVPRFLVQIRGNNIVDAGIQPLHLDADFEGTELGTSDLDTIWGVTNEAQFTDVIWDGLVDTGALLPTGDAHEGGLFHSWFEAKPPEIGE